MTIPSATNNNDAMSALAAYLNPKKEEKTDETKKTSLGQDDFLTLMTTQLKNQDPLKPLDSTQFVTQLAQFSQVAGTQEMNESLATLTESMQSSAVLNGTNLVGHYVLVDDEKAQLATDGTVVGAVEVPAEATSVSVNVRDAKGVLVDSFQLDTAAAGSQLFSWDGKKSDGTPAAAGEYTFEAIAATATKSVAAEVSTTDLVASVSIDPKDYSLTLNTSTKGALRLSEVRQVF